MITAKATTQGFQLLELMLVLALISGLVLLALPSYQSQLTQARRLAAVSALEEMRLAMEEHYLLHGSYRGAAGSSSAPADTGAPHVYPDRVPAAGPQVFYRLRIERADDRGFVLTAQPEMGQGRDPCGRLRLDSSGRWQTDGGLRHCRLAGLAGSR